MYERILVGVGVLLTLVLFFILSVPFALLSWAVFWVLPAVVLLGGQVLLLAWLFRALDITGLFMGKSELWWPSKDAAVSAGNCSTETSGPAHGLHASN